MINKVKIILVVVALIAMNSCKKENEIKNETVLTQQDSGPIVPADSNILVIPADFPYNIINLTSFDFDVFIGEYVVGDEVYFEEEVTDDDGMCYAVIITANPKKLREWIEKEEAKGKEVKVYFVTNNDKRVLGIAVSKDT